MYEDQTYENILDRSLARVASDVDKREGSVIMNAIAPVSAEHADVYIQLGNIVNNGYADTAVREFLILRCKERGIIPYEATKATLKGKFNMEIPIGSRFNLNELNYVATAFIESADGYFYYQMECETEGTNGNKFFGELSSIEYIDKDLTGELTELLIPAEDEEDTEALRTRYLNSFDSNLTNEGVMVAYRGETGYSEAGATSATITKGTTEYPSGTKVQTMVEQPLFYTKVVPVKSSVSSSGRGKKYDKARFYISPTPKAGFKPVDGFLDDNGILQDKIYLSAFEGSIFDTSAGAYLKADEQVADFATDMLSSIAGVKPASGLTQNLTRANVRKLCTNRGKGWKSHNIFALTATQWLILVEYASMNAQSVIGQGVSTFTDDGSTNMAVVTGATSGLGNGSGIDPNAGVDGKCSVSYRGEENLWGNIWTWLDAINIYNDKASGVYNAFVKPYGECKDDTTADGYKALDFNIATGEGYISGFGYDEDHPDLFLCAEHNGASNLPVGDYYWNNNDGFRVARLGGRWSNGARCGAWCLYLSTASSDRYRVIGGRLLYVPQTKISA